MFAELQMELGTADISYQQSSNLQGVIMENINTEYAEILHRSQLNPYSQYVTKKDKNVVWHIKTTTEEAYKNIIIPMSEVKEITLKKRGITVAPMKRSIQMMETKTLLDEFYDRKCSKYLEVSFLTPTAFKREGNYVFYPDLSLIYGSLMRKYSAISQQISMEDKETLEELCNSSEIVKYRLQTIPFPLEKINVTGFVGKIGIKIKGSETIARYIRLLLRFGEYSGVGIKTGIGMGAIKYGGKEDD